MNIPDEIPAVTQTTETNKPVVAVLNLDYPKGYEVGGQPEANLKQQSSASTTGSLISELYHLHEGSTLRVGRAKTNDIIINDRDISRFHATFSASSTGVVLCDLSSTNGTFVNDRRISTPVDLLSGDIVKIGDVKILLQLHYTEDPVPMETSRTELAELQAVEVTVLLADVCGYTRISQDLPGEEVAKMLRAWFEMVGAIIKRHGGEIDKYIGDCVMALWRGSTQNAKSLAENAATAGIEIVEETKQLGAVHGLWPHSEKHPWRCRTALNSGTALFGAVGAGDRRNYTVLGDAINVAFRIESLAGKLGSEMVASQVTADLLKEKFALKHLGSHDLEGRIGEMAIYAISTPGK